MKNFLNQILLTIFLFCFFSDAEKEKVLFCEVAYGGANKEITRNFPYTSNSSIDTNLAFRIGQETRSVLNELSLEGFDLIINHVTNDVFQALDKYSKVRTGFVVVIDGEYVNEKKLSDSTAIQYWLDGKLVFFDCETMRVKLCKPFGAMYDDVSDNERTDAEHRKVFRKILFGENGKRGLFFQSLAEKLNEVQLSYVGGKTLQIGEVIIEDDVFKTYKAKNISNFKRFIAGSVTKSFSDQLGIPFLPYVESSESSSKLLGQAGGFSVNIINSTAGSSKRFQMKLPEVDYRLDLTIPPFVKIPIKEYRGYKQMIYGAYIRMKLWEPMSEKVYFNERFKNALVRNVPLDDSVIPNEPFWQFSLLECGQHVASSLYKPDKEWINSQRIKKLDRKMKIFNEMLERCKND